MVRSKEVSAKPWNLIGPKGFEFGQGKRGTKFLLEPHLGRVEDGLGSVGEDPTRKGKEKEEAKDHEAHEGETVSPEEEPGLLQTRPFGHQGALHLFRAIGIGFFMLRHRRILGSTIM
jgi:hypothetical protein